MDNNSPEQPQNNSSPEQPHTNLPNNDAGNPIKPAPVRLAGQEDSTFGQPSISAQTTQPRVAPMNPSMMQATPPARPRGRMIIIFVGILALLSGIAALIFYFSYWINPSVVFSRFQRNANNVLLEAITNQSKLISNVKYSLTAESTDSDLRAGITSSGKALESSSESISTVTYKNSTLGLEFKQPPPTNGQSILYFKYQNLNRFLIDTVGTKQIKNLGLQTAGIQKYDNKWISVDTSSLLGSASSSVPTNTTDASTASDSTLTQSDYDSLNKAFAPIIATAISGTDKKKAIFSYDKPKSERVNGIDTYTYSMKYNQEAYNTMISDLSSAVDSTSLSDRKKTDIKTALEGLVQQPDANNSGGDKSELRDTPLELNEDQNNITQSINNTLSENKTSTTFTIWLEKNTSLPVQISIVTDITNAGSLTNQTTFKTNVKTFSSSSFTGEISLVSIDKKNNFNLVDSKIGYTINPNSSKIELSGTTIYKASKDAKDNNFKLELTLEPSTDNTPVQKPAQSTKFETVLQQILNAPAR